MLKFFRYIRQRLLSENRFSKYRLYALGEIMLVVIGILVRLLEDLEFAKTQSERFIQRENEDLDRLKLALGSQQELTEIIKQTNRDQFFYAAAWDLSFDIPVIITYTDLQNAGDTGKIQNTRLRNRLSEMGLRILMLESIIGDRLSVHQNRIDNIIEYELNFLPMLATKNNLPVIHLGEPNNYVQKMQKPNVRNLMGIKLDLTILILDLRESLDRELTQVIEMVQSEING